jgi:hypothetical protein
MSHELPLSLYRVQTAKGWGSNSPKRRCVELDISKKSTIYDFKLTLKDGEIFIDLKTLAKHSGWAKTVIEETDTKKIEMIQSEKRPGCKVAWHDIMHLCESDFLASIVGSRIELVYLMDYLRFIPEIINITVSHIIVYPHPTDNKFELIPKQYIIPAISKICKTGDTRKIVLTDRMISIVTSCNLKAELLDWMIANISDHKTLIALAPASVIAQTTAVQAIANHTSQALAQEPIPQPAPEPEPTPAAQVLPVPQAASVSSVVPDSPRAQFIAMRINGRGRGRGRGSGIQ